MNIKIVTEAVEVCPHCDNENVYINYDVIKNHYKAICESCGKEIFLCDECFHAEDNSGMKCDWREEGKQGICFRGICQSK